MSSRHMRDMASDTHVQQPAQHQSTSKQHPGFPGVLSGKHPSQLSERRQSASQVLKVFLGARSPGPVQGKSPTKPSRPVQPKSQPTEWDKGMRTSVLGSDCITTGVATAVANAEVAHTLRACASPSKPLRQRNSLWVVGEDERTCRIRCIFASSRVVNALTERWGTREGKGANRNKPSLPTVAHISRERPNGSKRRSRGCRGWFYIIYESNIR